MEKKEFINKEEIRKEIKEFKKFALKEDTIKISIAVIIGGAINKLANSISLNFINPIVNLLVYRPGNFWNNYAIKLNKDIEIEVGNLLSSFFEFLVISFIVYIVYTKIMKSLIKNDQNKKTCNFCMSEIHISAKKCPYCTSYL